VDLLAIASGALSGAAHLATNAEAEPLFQINLFQVLLAATNFVVFLAIIWTFAFKPIQRMLAERQSRIEQGLADAEQARKDRESAESERLAALQEARREANDIINRAQKVAQDSRDADIAATKAELDQMRERATTEIDAEKQRAIAELRTEVADLALRAAGHVVGETITSDREKRLVNEFLAETGVGASGGGGSSASKRGGSGGGATG